MIPVEIILSRAEIMSEYDDLAMSAIALRPTAGLPSPTVWDPLTTKKAATASGGLGYTGLR